ncbi:MAG TPA: 3-oxoacyl-[acyl-carrier-protein] synthase III C-terminal domain-containing protein [Mycobacteriales bacterium]|nr:3-oxoacyl-[acyl-carrier-protein] synthase III C-terminal domain-containing protein [Mycobacteriales bacterium]
MSARIAALAHAVPPAVDQATLWREYFGPRFGGDARAERVWNSAGVQRRHGVIDPRTVDVSTWSTGARMRRFLSEAVPLGKEAGADAIAAAGRQAGDLGLFAVATCTGYITPGLDIVLARDLGMSAQVQRLAIGHMGCYAALPGLGAAADWVRSRQSPALLLCCELPSLHVQPAHSGPLRRAHLEQLAAHALFADAAAAAVVVPDAPGLEILDVQAVTDAEFSDYMTWDVTDTGFRMGLSPRVPDVLARHVRGCAESLLERNGSALGDVTSWVVHPGGPRILDVTADRLGLDVSALDSAAEVLRENGNCSSATVLLVLEKVLPTLRDGDLVVMLAFGPGLTLYAALLRFSA